MSLKKLGVYILAVLGAIVFVYWKGCQRGISNSGPSLTAALKPSDREQVLIDPTHHTLTIVTRNGVTKTTLPDRATVITEHNDGTLSLNTPQFGYEMRPFVGAGVGDGFRLAAGGDFLYFKKLDIGLAMTFQPSTFHTARAAVFLSYTVWSNTRISLGFDHQKTVSGMLTIRL